MKKNLLFDLDGTLTDPKEGIIRCLQHALEKGGHPVPPAEDLLWCIGPPLHHSFAKLVPGRDEAYAWKLVDLYRERYKPTGQFENRVYDGIPELLANAKRTKKLFIATSKAEPFAVTIAEHFGFAKHFDRIHGCMLTGERSDKAELVAYILATEKLRPEETVMIGDRMHDIRGGKLNGVSTIGVTWGYGSREELVAAGADHVVDSVAELGQLLERL